MKYECEPFGDLEKKTFLIKDTAINQTLFLIKDTASTKNQDRMCGSEKYLRNSQARSW